MSETPKVEVFFCDYRDADGNTYEATMSDVETSWGPVTPVKIPHEEMAMDPERTIHVKLDGDSDA